MSLLLLTLGTTTLLLFLFYKYIIKPTCISSLSQIPNAHFTSPITPVWIWWKRRIGFECRSIFAAHQKHGSIVRLGPKELSVTSLDGVRQIYTAGFEKDPWYRDEFMRYQTPNLVSMLHNKPHSVRKRMITNVYSKSYLYNSQDLQTLSSVLLHDRLLPLLQHLATNKEPVDVLEMFRAASMDFMSAYIFGITNSTDFLHDAPARQHYFQLYRTESRHLPGADRAIQELEAFCMSMCQAAEEFSREPPNPFSTATTPSTKAVVYSQLSSQLDLFPHPTYRKDLALASETFDHLIASHETSGVTLTYLAYELSRNPVLQSSLRGELLTLSPHLTHPLAPAPSRPNNEGKPPSVTVLPTPAAIATLPLLNALIYETLRRYTVSPTPQLRLTPPGGATIAGHANIPAGVRVSASAYCLHRNAAVFPEALAFRPERWMRGDKGEGGAGSEEMRRWFWAFGSGGRMCLGSHFAVLGKCSDRW